MDEGTIENQVIVVTGAAGRLGRRVVESLAHRGARIAAVDIDAEAVRSIPYPNDAEGWAYPADVTDGEQVRASFAEIKDKFGGIDALVHTAGGWASNPLLETSLKDWERLIDLNLTSTFLCFREAVHLMQPEGGRLIAISSGQGADKGLAKQASYSASKAGVIRVVESVADEFQDQGITAHAIAPSTILFGDSSRKGVPADRVVDLCGMLLGPAGDALNGQVVRAYGSVLRT